MKNLSEKAASVSALDGSDQQVCRQHRERLRDLVRCDRLGAWEGDGARSFAEWLSGRYGISNWKARRQIEAAYALEHLPRIAAALASGVLSLDKTVELTRLATPETERKLITWARRVSPSAIRQRGDRERKPAVEEAEQTEKRRYLNLWEQDDGCLQIDGLLPPAEGAVVKSAIDRLAAQLPKMPLEEGSAPWEETTFDMLRADALGLIASARIAGDNDPDRATVVLHVTPESLTSGTLESELAGGQGLDPATAQRLSCDCRMQWVAEKDGWVQAEPVSQSAPRWLRRLVLRRSKGRCSFPGCGSAAFLQCHHLRHWSRGGKTAYVNLVALCHSHHKLVHEYRWSVTLENDEPVFFRPSGRVYDPVPPAAQAELEPALEGELASRDGPVPGSIEDLYGIPNFDLQETISIMEDDPWQISRALAGV